LQLGSSALALPFIVWMCVQYYQRYKKVRKSECVRPSHIKCVAIPKVSASNVPTKNKKIRFLFTMQSGMLTHQWKGLIYPNLALGFIFCAIWYFSNVPTKNKKIRFKELRPRSC
jgi:hypothetical protein